MSNPKDDMNLSRQYYEARAKWLGEIKEFQEMIAFNQKQVEALDLDFKFQPDTKDKLLSRIKW